MQFKCQTPIMFRRVHFGYYPPQHYSQATKDIRGTYSTNFGDQVIFVWDHGRFKATMPLSAATNVGILRSVPGHKVFTSFVDLDPGDSTEPQAFFCSAVVSDSEADDLESDADDEATLSSTASLEGDDEDKGNNTTNTIERRATDIARDTQSTPSDTRQDTSSAQSDVDRDTPDTPNRPDIIPFDLEHDDPATSLTSQDDATSSLARCHLRTIKVALPP
jgi:hypothetical protein